ncbi:hypothetical protein Anapl_12308 [Anas platyrhynchos]|uniref:Uncharacterized protein n=1 Tax=Anas platyrhynchos TaxID=8839 RepID=R0JIQ9_ANAPL|nr:hypothetical protein Anapl_12308 [Anas platyrhynchos]
MDGRGRDEQVLCPGGTARLLAAGDTRCVSGARNGLLHPLTVLGDLIPPLGNPVLASDILVLVLVLLGQPYITLYPGETFALASFYPFRLTVSNADAQPDLSSSRWAASAPRQDPAQIRAPRIHPRLHALLQLIWFSPVKSSGPSPMAGEAQAPLLAPPKPHAAPQVPPFCWWDLSETPAPGPAGSTSLRSAGRQGINPKQAQEVQKMEVLVALPSAQCQRGAGSSVVLFSTPNGLFQFRAKKNTSCFQYVLSKHSKSPLPELLQQTCWTQHQETCDAVFRLPSHICLVSTAATLTWQQLCKDELRHPAAGALLVPIQAAARSPELCPSTQRAQDALGMAA